MKIRIGTRGSKLARWQADWVAKALTAKKVDVELVYLQTLGDVKSGPIGSVGGEGVFTKEIQRALLDEQVDLAVHSLKDLPTDVHEALALAAVPAREECGDALVAGEVAKVSELPAHARVGTGSARRRAQLLAYRRDLQIVDLRGNVDTRLKKLRDGEMDAIVLAEAGLRRLGLDDQISQVLPKQLLMPAVGQGALGLEIRASDNVTRAAVQQLNDPSTHQAVTAERSLLRSLRGGCLAPVGAWARMDQEMMRLDAVVLNADGTKKIAASDSAPAEHSDSLGKRVANALLAQGAAELLNEARKDSNAKG